MSTLPSGARMFIAAGLRDDPLEQTQDMGRAVNMFGGELAPGVFRVVRDEETPDFLTLQRAPELSERYPVVPVNLTRRQAE